MLSRWNLPRSDHSDDQTPEDPGSTARGPNVSRRGFVEIAIGALAGASLVGLSAAPAAASTAQAQPSTASQVRPCDGQLLPAEDSNGFAAQVIAYEELNAIHRTHN